MRSALAGVALGLLLAVGMTSCVVRTFLGGHRLTGTCDGACAHYVECKPGHPEAARAQCRAQCPEVFSDRDSLMAYESLSCQDAVEYVDGSPARAATLSR